MGPGMLGEHEDKPLLLCSNTIGPFWINRSESGFWGTSIRSPSPKYRNPEDHFKCNRSSQYLEGPLKILRPYFDFDTCTVPFLMTPFRICISGTGHSPQHNSSGLKKKKKPGDSYVFMCVIKWSDFISYGRRFLFSALSAGWISIELENQLWLSFLTVSHFLWYSPLSGHQLSTTLPLLCPKVIKK